jgi:hypothetical protein
MKQSSDYKKFNLLDYNRQTSEHQVKKLKESIEKYGYIASNPIIVDRHYNIIDGQHRFIACKELGLPIIYEIADEGNDIIITLNTTQRKWNLSDYVNYYSYRFGNINYIRLKQLAEKYNLKPNTILILLNGYSASTKDKEVKNGSLKFTKDEELTVNNNLSAIKKIAENLKQRVSVRFIEGLLQLSRMSNFNWLVMLEKSQKFPTLAYNCITRNDYIEMLKGIYNYKTKSASCKI